MEINNNFSDSTVLYNQKWYRRIKSGDKIEGEGEENNQSKKHFALFDEHPKQSTLGKLLVHLECIDRDTKKKVRLFSLFNTHLEFARYQQQLLPEHRCFFETVLAEVPQKIRFDIDYTPVETKEEREDYIKPDDIRNDLITALDTVMRELGIDLSFTKDILIFTSHGNSKEGKRKYSYHIVINNYCCVNNKEAKEIYNRCIKKMNVEYAKYVDIAVYSTLQQFRIVGSRKQGTNRVKTLCKEWYYTNDDLVTYEYLEAFENENHKIILELEASLLTVTSACQYLPTLVEDETEDGVKKTNSGNYEEIDMSIARKAVEMFANFGGMSSNSARFPYKLMGINGSLVLLKRLKPSKCIICSPKVHQNENPFLIVIGEEQSVYFHCRRAPPDKKYHLGKLNPKSKDGTILSDSSTTAIQNNPNIVNIPINTAVNINELKEMASHGYREIKSKKPDISDEQVREILRESIKKMSWGR